MIYNSTSHGKIFFCFIFLLVWTLSNLGAHIYILLNMLILFSYIFGHVRTILKTNVTILLFSFFYIIYGYLNVPKDIIDNTAYIASCLYGISGLLAVSVYFSFDSFVRFKALKYIFYLFVLVVFLQQTIFILSGYYLDLHNAITLFLYESRYNNNFTFLGPMIRPTLFFQEPSNAAIVIYGLSFLSYINGNKDLCLKYIYISFLTFSFAAFVMGVFIIFHLFITRMSIMRKSYVLILVLLLCSLPFLVNLFENINFGYNAVGYRLRFLELLQSANYHEVLFGFGLYFILEPAIIHGITLNSSHFKDTGFLVNILLSSGILGLSIFLTWLSKNSRNVIVFGLLVAIFMTKIEMNMPTFWIVVYSLSFYSVNFQNKKT